MEEAFTQNGVSLTPLDASSFHSPPRIVVGARVNQPSENDETRSRTLQEDSEFGINSLREYGGADEVRILDRQSTKVQGYPALLTSVRYKKGALKEVWQSFDLTILTQDGTIFFIELECHPDDLLKLRPTFEHLQKSFKLRCRK